MNQFDIVKYLAIQNAGSAYPKRFEDLDTSIPYLKIKKNSYDRWQVEGHGHQGHDNEPRMHFMTEYINQNILPNIDPKSDLDGYYPIQLHDSYTYLNDDKNYKHVMSYSKFTNDNKPVLLPDMYMLCNWGNQLQNISDPYKKWEEKKRKVCFFGTTTGSRDPLKNERINTCLWARDKRDYCDFYITNVAQMDPKNIQNLQEIYSKPVDLNEQMKYAYIMTMDGNTCPFHCNSYFLNSLTFKYKSKEMLWYYPLLQNKSHFVEVDVNNMNNTFKYYENNKKEAEFIISNANQFAKNWFNKPIIPQQYMVTLFETISLNK